MVSELKGAQRVPKRRVFWGIDFSKFDSFEVDIYGEDGLSRPAGWNQGIHSAYCGSNWFGGEGLSSVQLKRAS